MAKVLNDTAQTAVNQTANATSTASTNTAVQQMLQDPVLIGVSVAAVLALIIALIMRRETDEEDPYQGTKLSKRLFEKQVEPALEFGQGSSKKVEYGVKELGQLESWYKTTEQTAEGILDDIHKQEPEEDDVDAYLDSQNGEYKNITMVVGPTGWWSRLKMNSRHTNPVKNPHLSVYSVPKKAVNNGSKIQIDDEKVDWNYVGGIYYSKDVPGMTTLYNFTSLSLIDDLTEVFANKGEITQALNEKFAEWKNKKQVENQAFIDYMKEKEDIDADTATD